MKAMSRRSFLSVNSVGVILRVYSANEADIPKRIKMVTEAVQAIRNMVVEGIQLVKRIDVLVWADQSFPDSDCGKTADEMRTAFSGQEGVFVSEFKQGDIFCGILNYGVMLQSIHGITHSIVASAEANSYMTKETAEAMVDAVCEGAKAVPVAINELTQSILEGRGANTFMMWHNMSLMTVGGFDLKAAKPRDEKTAHYMRGWSEEKGEMYYQLAGVEEIIPLIRMSGCMSDPFIAPIVPKGNGAQAYIVPDPATDYEGWKRHISKMGTKFERQLEMAVHVGADLSVLKGAVMKGYRQY